MRYSFILVHGRRSLRVASQPRNKILVLSLIFLVASGTTYGGLFKLEGNSLKEINETEPQHSEQPLSLVDPLQSSRYKALLNYSDVLVIRNLNSSSSIEIADYFVREREIPPVNVCNVSITPAEVIDRNTFNNLMNQIVSYMTDNNLLNKINIIVTTKGVPLKITDSLFSERRASVDSELALINGKYAGNIAKRFWFPNPYFNSTERHSFQKHQVYIVTRLTGYTVEDAKALVDRATKSLGRRGRFVLDIDPRRDGSPGYKVGNDWMRVAYDILTSRGFDVLIDESNTFLNNKSKVAGYTSWGSNDGSWYIPENTNIGFETDLDGDNIPDGWLKTEKPGSEVVRTNVDALGGNWCIRINSTQVDGNYSAISQNFTPTPDRRYVFMGSANLTNVSPEKGVHLQIQVYDSIGTLIQTLNGSARSGTTSSYVGLGQVVYEPNLNATRLVISALLSMSSGTVYLDNLRLIEIKPHNTWVAGAVGETYVSTGGRSFNYPTMYGQSLVADLIKDGITGVKGYVYEPYLTAVAHPNILFERYTSGWALGESFLAASEIGTSWMDLILGDPKVAPYNQSYLPDLYINPDFFILSNDFPLNGSEIQIEVRVENLGNFPAVNATTSIYLGNPGLGGIPLHNHTGRIDYLSSERFNITWTATGPSGEYDLCVLADPFNEFYELDEGNNLACHTIRISDGIYLQKGWNLISLPFEPYNNSIFHVLKSIDGYYDMMRFYDANDTSDPWKSYYSFKPYDQTDFAQVDRQMGFWIHVLSNTTLRINGSYYRSTFIYLKAGWNLIGFPSLRDQRVEDVFSGLPLLRIESFDPGPEPYLVRRLNGTSYMSSGKGYWVLVAEDCSLKVSG